MSMTRHTFTNYEKTNCETHTVSLYNPKTRSTIVIIMVMMKRDIHLKKERHRELRTESVNVNDQSMGRVIELRILVYFLFVTYVYEC